MQSVTRSQAQVAAEKASAAKRAAKASQQALEREMAQMFKTVQKPAKQGMDPKSVLCEYFKQGLCLRGDKCKFSHDASQVRKVAKLDSTYCRCAFPFVSDARDVQQYIRTHDGSTRKISVRTAPTLSVNTSWMRSRPASTAHCGCARITARTASITTACRRASSCSATRS